MMRGRVSGRTILLLAIAIVGYWLATATPPVTSYPSDSRPTAGAAERFTTERDPGYPTRAMDRP